MPNLDHTADELSVLIRCHEDHDVVLRLHSRHSLEGEQLGYVRRYR